MSVLKGTIPYKSYEISDIVAYNIKEMYDYGLLELGAFTQVNYNETYGALKKTASKVFEGIGPSWVWESGVQTVDGSASPFPVSGIYFNGNFLPNGTAAASGAYSSSWYVDYRNGRVIFNTDPPTGTTVRCTYCTRDVAVYLSDSIEWKTIQDNYESRYESMDDIAPSGLAQILKKNRVWLPCMVIDVVNADIDPLQLGGGEIANCSVYYHILSDRPKSCRRLCDMILAQDDTNINLFNVNQAPYKLNYNGSLYSGAVEYSVQSHSNYEHFWTRGFFNETNGGFQGSEWDIYRGMLRNILHVYRYNSTY